ncbi:hypothetical protein [Roseibium aggregatum]|uniref:hypothetical protein n=1 Tax=Roseibium aggregatum TaxID=187304 RepID=UPI001E48A21F|nr:hypothetical protein [Roseibium aggregatum]UES40373.1 hypothetical protein GFC08_22420 [Roseibium aggregatum]
MNWFLKNLEILGLYQPQNKQFFTPELISLISGLGGAIIGACVGGFISWLIARQAANLTLKRDEEARIKEQKSHALSLMIKASLVLADVVAIAKLIDQSLSTANENKLTNQPLWRRIVPTISHKQTFEVEAVELAPLMEAKANEIVYAATELFLQHATLITALEKYAILRGEMKKLIPTHLGTKDTVVVSALTESEVAALAPYELELESLISEVRSMLPELREKAEKVSFGIGPAIRAYYEAEDFPMLIDGNKDQSAKGAE